MPVSLAGLDLSWMKDPANCLPPRPKVRARRAPNKRSTKVAAPFFMSDIRAFVSPVGETPEVISSRPQLREHERKHNCYQTGNDYKPGDVAATNQAKWQAREDLAKAYDVKTGWGDV